VSSLLRRGGGSNSPVVPPEAAVFILRQAIFHHNDGPPRREQEIWLIDGFPRNKKHVEAWIRGQMPLAQCVIYLTCPKDVLIQRILSRASTSGRPDDAVPDLVRERVERNVSERDAMLSALVEHGMAVLKIDGTQDVETVRQVVLDNFMVSLL
jgi:adenylate kinase family enzyme